MKKLFVIIIVINILVINKIIGQTTPLRFKTTSKHIEDAVYVIDIILPEDYDSTCKYPIVYCVDNWLGEKFAPGIISYLNFSQAIDPIIVVGIGNEGNYNDWQLERTRDLTPYHITKYDQSSSNSVGSRGVTGGAGNFLLFIKNELIPMIETKYNSDPLNRSFMGYSYGGLFGMYTLITEPELFQKYFLGSPSLFYNDFSLLDSLNSMTSEELSNIKTIYLTVGDKESGTMLKGFADLRDCLKNKNISSLDARSLIIVDEDHRSAVIPAYYKAFKYLFKRE